MEPSSEELLGQAATGGSAALATLLQRHLPWLRACVRLRMGPEIRANEASCDLVQSVCREILVHADRFQHGGEHGFRHWLFRTAQRKIADRADYYHAARRRAGRAVSLDADDGELLQCYRTMCTPSRDASARETLARVEAAFDRLSEEHREVILGARVLGLPHRELATRLGKSEVAVRALLFRAMARLTELLGDGADAAT
jgi:RNA polymerase sigma-70 factor, ECF subfamily